MASLIKSIIGHQKKLEMLLSAIQNDQLPPQLLFYGPPGIGKKKIAFSIAQAILCEHKIACGTCSSCIRVATNCSESLFVISSEKNLIKIEKTREVLDFLSLKAWEKNRVIIIEEAHTLNPQASNALLKIFEEPPENTFFILITHRPRLLLTTIRSRSKMVGFQPLTIEELNKFSQNKKIILNAKNSNLKEPNPEWMLRSARGSIETLETLENQESTQIRTEAATYLLEFINQPDHFFTSNWRDKFKNREEVSNILNWWMVFLRDSLVPEQFIFSKDQKKLIDSLNQIEFQKRLNIFKKLQDSDRALWGYQDPILIIENLFISGFYNI